METRTAHKTSHCSHGTGACAELPDLKRLNYFYGQMLGVQDFRTEQAYFRDKHKLHNRSLHGYGTVCGLKVVPEPTPQNCKDPVEAERAKLQSELVKIEFEAARKAGDEQHLKEMLEREEEIKRAIEKLPPNCKTEPTPRVVLECGLGLDCDGNEIVVQRPHAIDPWHWLSQDERKRATEEGGIDLYLSICYCEQPIDPVRPVLPDACGATPQCSHGKLRDAYTVHITSEAPPRDTHCDLCCTCCDQPCLLLAVLRGYSKGLGAKSIDNSVRRLVETTAHPATTITGISWTHGATYSASDASEIIGAPDGTAGIQVNFSRPVQVSTLTDGVVDLWVIEGGRSKHSGMYWLEGAFESFGGASSVQSFRFRYQGDENLDPGDRLMVTIRCAFILDECCRPVDGAHVGGHVPLIDDPEFEKFNRAQTPTHYALKPPGYGPWTTGAGTPGATFESWFFIEASAKSNEKRRAQEIRK